MTGPKTADGTAELDQLPPDIATMVATADRLLAFDAKPIGPDDLDTLRLTLRGQVELMVPLVEQQAGRFPKGDVSRECALACTREAQARLGLGVGGNSPVRMSVAMKLARSVVALCHHYEHLCGAHS